MIEREPPKTFLDDEDEEIDGEEFYPEDFEDEEIEGFTFIEDEE